MGILKWFKLLLENSAQVDLTSNNGWSALIFASRMGHSEVVKLLLKNRAQVESNQQQWVVCPDVCELERAL